MQNLALWAITAALAAPAVLAEQGETPAAPVQAAPVQPAAIPASNGFNAQVAFSPTYKSGYYYASPYSGYTSLSYYGSIYTSRRFGG